MSKTIKTVVSLILVVVMLASLCLTAVSCKKNVEGAGDYTYKSYSTSLGHNWNPHTWETNADEAFYMTATLKCGAVGTVTVSKLTVGANDDLSLCVYGEKGSIKFSLMQPNFLYFYDATVPSGTLGGNAGYTAIECVGRYPSPSGSFPAPKAPSSWIRAHMQSMYEFLYSVHSGIPHSPTFDDGAHIQKVMEAAYNSDKTGKVINI